MRRVTVAAAAVILGLASCQRQSSTNQQAAPTQPATPAPPPAPNAPKEPTRVLILKGSDKALPCRILRQDEETITVELTETREVITVKWDDLEPAERGLSGPIGGRPKAPAKPPAVTQGGAKPVGNKEPPK